MTSIEQTPKKLLFLSLKWKVVLGISLVLIIVNFAVTMVTYKQILLQFDQNRIQTQQTYEREFEGLVKNSFDRMRQLSYLIPLLKITTNVPSKSFQYQLQEIIKEHISLLQIEYGLNSLYYFQETEQALVTWNGVQLSDAVKKILMCQHFSGQFSKYFFGCFK
ncbi:hypothetical protein [sulfur-oxidizing endosymbiont of Gigantopelta aegis]|uniref:hypothetical protein n=1 Tax=sulfur-oxidizing endosymbiont of Gigantopelta aegis TaxID=2794934 RepID=UPI0018DE92F8|nr:hypothetical protein [sulfur-oxidizing endosymbiont of Gigantopelta aegis]